MYDRRFLSTYCSSFVSDIEFVVDLPSVGNIRNLSFTDVVELLQLALEFLVGDTEVDSVESCSGGLLGLEVDNEPIFTYKLPGKLWRTDGSTTLCMHYQS